MTKIYFAMSDLDIGCFEWDSIYFDEEKAIERVFVIHKRELNYLRLEERKEYAKKHWVVEAEVV